MWGRGFLIICSKRIPKYESCCAMLRMRVELASNVPENGSDSGVNMFTDSHRKRGGRGCQAIKDSHIVLLQV